MSSIFKKMEFKLSKYEILLFGAFFSALYSTLIIIPLLMVIKQVVLSGQFWCNPFMATRILHSWHLALIPAKYLNKSYLQKFMTFKSNLNMQLT